MGVEDYNNEEVWAIKTYASPQIEVTFDYNFEAGIYELTNAQGVAILNWAYGMGYIEIKDGVVVNTYGKQQTLINLQYQPHCQLSWSGESLVIDSGMENYPLVTLTWHGAVAIANFLSEIRGYAGVYDFANWNAPVDHKARGFRLPSESEWEYFARAGTTTRYFFGDDTSDIGDYAWYVNNSYNPDLDFVAHRATHSVGQKLANPWGLYDIYGNAREWTQDHRGINARSTETPYSTFPGYENYPTNGSAYYCSRDPEYRTERGGSWLYSSEQNLRSAYRGGRYAWFSNYENGVRLVFVN